jgi:hypothetical protein
LKRSFHCRNGKGIARQRTTDATYIRVINIQPGRELLAHFLREAIRCGGHSSSQRLADGEEIRLKSM